MYLYIFKKEWSWKILNCPFKKKYSDANSGVARAFPGGRAAHPENQNEEENE